MQYGTYWLIKLPTSNLGAEIITSLNYWSADKYATTM